MKLFLSGVNTPDYLFRKYLEIKKLIQHINVLLRMGFQMPLVLSFIQMVISILGNGKMVKKNGEGTETYSGGEFFVGKWFENIR